MLIFTAIFLLMFFGLQYLKPKKEPEPPPSRANASAAKTPQAPEQPAAVQPTQTDAVPASSSIAALSEATTVVENELYRITFTNRGAQVKSWILKKYKDDDGKPLDLVNQATAAKFGYPLSLFTYDQSLKNRLATALYVPSITGTVAAPGFLSFDYSSGSL